ncbi:MAG: tRNA preQ1(34) S-adenosylmethionine ribosyltransferase-isomerase QueA [Gemmatimonadales bacterium]
MYSLSDFDYHLPKSLIAQHPTEARDASRLLHYDRHTKRIDHMMFRDIVRLPSPGDVLVLNTSRVIPARLSATRDNGREAEVLLVHEDGPGIWTAMVHPGGKLKTGRRLTFGADYSCRIVEVLGGGLRRVEFQGDVRDIMARFGSVPLPPYIRRPASTDDSDRYQTVYAREDGSVAAPTAGLHFTTDILREIEAAGCIVVETVLHVGPGTFKPVASENPANHKMHAEYYRLPEETVRAITDARGRSGKIWCVGTTTARVLEACAVGGLKPGSGWTDIFIRPGYRFKFVDALITNFHLPRSTLLMLVAAFAGLDETLAAYRAAVDRGYRFYSYGDAMVIT